MNISHLGTDAEVQLAEALVAVSEAVVAAAAEGDDTPRVVAVEETTHSEDDAVMQQVCALVLNFRLGVHSYQVFFEIKVNNSISITLQHFFSRDVEGY